MTRTNVPLTRRKSDRRPDMWKLQGACPIIGLLSSNLPSSQASTQGLFRHYICLLMTSFLYHSIGAELHPPQKVCYSLNYRNTLFEARIFLYMIKLRWGHTGLKQALNSVTRVLARTEELRDRHGSHHDSWSGAETDRTRSHRIAFAPKDEETAGRIPLGPVSGKWPCIYPDVRFLTQTCKRISFCYFKWHFVAVATRN